MDGTLKPGEAPRPPSTAEGPLPAYRAKVAAGELRSDPAQAQAAEILQDLWRRTRGYDPKREVPTAEPGSGFMSRFFRRKPVEEAPGNAPQGLYLVGEVGRGKSMLMDLFFLCADVPRKQRIHFHQFMQQSHQRIHAWKKQHGDSADPIPPLADSITAEASLLCFDEFQVHDIADAMILGRLFEALFARGTVIVATSNTAPDDLFKGRPGRDAFLPFIALINRHVSVLQLKSQQDYRRDRIQGLPTWHSPVDGRAERALNAAFKELTGKPHGEPEEISVLGRKVRVSQAVGGVARADFDELCGLPLGPADYLALSTHFHTLVLDGIPRLGPDNFDRARRFITLVDTLYEHRCKLVASAAAEPDRLYEQGENAAMFQRTASRLMEMQSHDYLGLPHLT
ncbi:cell division protein ZapE [Teichococcus cervicalis]|uniref:ATPase, AFG1 family n=1 Tax=Pseudoroseomonas cervicalis ATCC 49957 TaxID=525371 RepID=D5RI53_9PROT|nr:cell division protein ZapE [Pseudoroseomonas cervicalis]EFH13020.1 ATPase, AFG1 family [Pseudoroseomonas cervicalis ATCC 49957]